MSNTNNAAAGTPPIILAIAGHDPGGAAGVQADIETIHAMNCRAASLITACTAQSTSEFVSIHPQDEHTFRAQAEVLLRDLNFSACKIGMLATPGIATCVAGLLRRLGPIPVVLDPVTHSGTGAVLADEELLNVIRNELLPLITVLTPNTREALELSGRRDKAEAGARLLEMGAANVLITGADEQQGAVKNFLFRPGGEAVVFEYERLPHLYHGSGCTLSAAIAAAMGLGFDTVAAIRTAQDYTWEALRCAVRLGRGQYHPTRATWAKKG